MRKTVIFTMAACMLLSGCGIRIAIPGEESAAEYSWGIFDEQSTYFDRYSVEKDENTCRVRGTIHQAADDQNCGLTSVRSEGGTGSLTVTGRMNSTDGNIRLLYIAPDGTQTLIAEGTDRKMDVQIDVAEGEGEISFASDDKGSVCSFNIKMEAGRNVSFSGDMEAGESTEDLEAIEEPEEIEDGMEGSGSLEEPDRLWMGETDSMEADLESIDIKEIEDNWPESIRYHADGLCADPMTVTFQVDKPMTLSISCKTRDGRLRFKLAGPKGIREKVCFDETDPDGVYTVELDSPGEYQMLFYAEYHVGSVEIVPLEDEM